MSKRSFSILTVLLICWSALPAGVAAEGKKTTMAPTKSHLLHVCIVSGEHLPPGGTVEYVYKKEGQPDRVVRLCCHRCEARFKADPEKYLKKLDEAEARQAAAGANGETATPPAAQ